jgi:purine-nucleoside phosphorylase
MTSSAFPRDRLPARIDAAVVLGSGLDAFSATLRPTHEIRVSDIPGWPRTHVPGHAGRIMAAQCGGRGILVFRGRPHMYEGHDAQAAAAPAELAAALGARFFLVTSAAGGLHPTLLPGDLFLSTDILVSPLAPGMGSAMAQTAGEPRRILDPALQRCARWAATDLGLALREGVYAFCSGPTYETRAEIRMLRRIGADAVGMSTAPEVLAAARIGMRVLALSCITNTTSTVPRRVSHANVTSVAEAAAERMSSLLARVLECC